MWYGNMAADNGTTVLIRNKGFKEIHQQIGVIIARWLMLVSTYYQFARLSTSNNLHVASGTKGMYNG